MRVAAEKDVLARIHDQFFQEFQITTSDSGRFLGMDTEYDLDAGCLRCTWQLTLNLQCNDLLVLTYHVAYRTVS